MIVRTRNGFVLKLPNGVNIDIDLKGQTDCENPSVTVYDSNTGNTTNKYKTKQEMPVLELIKALNEEALAQEQSNTEGNTMGNTAQGNLKYSSHTISDSFDTVDGVSDSLTEEPETRERTSTFDEYASMRPKENLEVDINNSDEFVQDFELILEEGNKLANRTKHALLGIISVLNMKLDELKESGVNYKYPVTMFNVKFKTDGDGGIIVANNPMSSYILRDNYNSIKQVLLQELQFIHVTEQTHRPTDFKRTLGITHTSEQPIRISDYNTNSPISLTETENVIREVQRLYYSEMENKTADALKDNEQVIIGRFSNNDTIEIVLQNRRAIDCFKDYERNIQTLFKKHSLTVKFASGRMKTNKQTKGLISLGKTTNFEIESQGQVPENFKRTCEAIVQRLDDTLQKANIKGKIDDEPEGIQFTSQGTVCIIKPLTDDAYYFLSKVANQLVDSFAKLGATDFAVVSLDDKKKKVV